MQNLPEGWRVRWGCIHWANWGKYAHKDEKSFVQIELLKKLDIKESSAFYKHLINKHGGMSTGTTFEDYFTVEIVKAYNKPMSKQTEEGTFMINIKGELLNKKKQKKKQNDTNQN